MERILKAGQLAPTAVNYQPQKIYILKSQQAIQTIRSVCQSVYDAPVVLLICADDKVDMETSERTRIYHRRDGRQHRLHSHDAGGVGIRYWLGMGSGF